MRLQVHVNSKLFHLIIRLKNYYFTDRNWLTIYPNKYSTKNHVKPFEQTQI